MNCNMKVNWTNFNGTIALLASFIGGFLTEKETVALAGFVVSVILIFGRSSLDKALEIIKIWKGQVQQ